MFVAQLFEYRELYAANAVIRIKFSIEGFIDIPASAIQKAPFIGKRATVVPGRRVVVLQNSTGFINRRSFCTVRACNFTKNGFTKVKGMRLTI